MGIKVPKHNIESVFILTLFAVFAVAVVAVLALGANSYKKLVDRDDDAYNKRIVTSYITAKIRGGDAEGAVAVGGFAKAEVDDGTDTLHLYQTIEGQTFDTRIYLCEGQVCEMLTTKGNNTQPKGGNVVAEAKELSFEKIGPMVKVHVVDKEGRESNVTVKVRCESEVRS